MIHQLKVHHLPQFSKNFMKMKIIHSAQYRPKSLKFSQLAWIGSALDILKWGWPWVKIKSWPVLNEGVLRCENRENCSLLSQSIENQKLHNIYKIQLHRLIRRRDIQSFHIFGQEKRLFLSYLPSKLSQGVEIWYINLVGTIDVTIGLVVVLNMRFGGMAQIIVVLQRKR